MWYTLGKNRLTDVFEVEGFGETNIGKLLLSPTRTFAPILKPLLEEHFDKIHGLIHCSGGGQTKCLKYLPGDFKIVKDNLFEAPPVFKLIQKNSGSNNREMYEVFNMGCRLEVYCAEKDASIMIKAAQDQAVDAQVIGHVESNVKKALEIQLKDELIVY
jgi:phosphoribosylformylglycinamidine cyclo-ligase